ncbi:DUF4870 domain-containing protein [Thermococcus sp. 21S9]|uniref:DUF4870 domain-containing protein n=1 Tax=Thermococcus sp. 21S9 TaxID=1638223 RepID=UPI00143AB90A|nr:DUF4870 domain-containing protein [Thermococcus sp. 21S9]NJE55627.1 DUF4870 domain-containing protein [Thermococcus sp. 21S9]
MGEEIRKTSLGMDENVEGLLAYLLWWLTGIILLLLEKESYFVRFHAMQSTVTFLFFTIAIKVFQIIPIIGWLIAYLLSLLAIIAWIVGMLKAYQGELYKFPIFGDLAEQWVEKFNV